MSTYTSRPSSKPILSATVNRSTTPSSSMVRSPSHSARLEFHSSRLIDRPYQGSSSTVATENDSNTPSTTGTTTMLNSHGNSISGVTPVSPKPAVPKKTSGSLTTPHIVVVDGENYDLHRMKSLIITLKEETRVANTMTQSLRVEVQRLEKKLRKKDEKVAQLQREMDKFRSVLDLKVGSLSAGPGHLLSLLANNGSGDNPLRNNSPTSRNKKVGVSAESHVEEAGERIRVSATSRHHPKDAKTKQLITKALQENQFLRHLTPAQMQEVVESMTEERVEQDCYLINEGDMGARLYVSAEGTLDIIKGKVVQGSIGPGHAFGELALLYGCQRTASVKASTEAKVLVLDRQAFQSIMMLSNSKAAAEKIAFLESVPLLKSLPRDKLVKLADVLDEDTFKAGVCILREGEVGQSFFLIKKGKVRVTQNRRGSTAQIEVRTLNPGEYFGEKALLRDDVRTANVTALDATVELFVLDRVNFKHLIGDLEELKDKDYGDEKRFSRALMLDDSMYQNMRLDELDRIATIGSGGFGRVDLVVWIKDRSQSLALKCLGKHHIVETKQQSHIIAEKNILLQCNCDFIVKLHRTFKDKKYVYMLMEACLGGEVWSILRDKTSFDDTLARFVLACVLESLEYLHTHGIVYRDLKPENLLFDAEGYTKLCDFGFAKYIGRGRKTWTFCGTSEYIAPEIVLNKGHDFAADYWSLGILSYELLTGNPPFQGDDPMKIYNQIMRGVDVLDFPKSMSPHASHLIRRLCRDNPAERLGYGSGGVDDIRRTKYFQGFDWHGLRTKSMPSPYLPNVKDVTDVSRFDDFPRVIETEPDEMSGWDANF